LSREHNIEWNAKIDPEYFYPNMQP
jgi:hypothetical protein